MLEITIKIVSLMFCGYLGNVEVYRALGCMHRKLIKENAKEN
jgi:predicted LPLAT superfamily acyltransferase